MNMTVAVNDRRRNSAGEWEDVPNFVDVTMFGNRAQALAKHLAKGAKVAIEGKLRWSQWQDRQTGANRSKLEVVVDEIEFMDARNAHQGGGAPQQGGYQQQAQNGAQNGSYDAYGQRQQAVANAQPYASEDIPF